MTPEAQNGFRVLLHLMNAAETEEAKCDVLKSFTDDCVESALASRTEQCAKICDQMAAVWNAEAKRVAGKNDLQGVCNSAKRDVAEVLAIKIRALNQPEQKAGPESLKKKCDFEPSENSGLVCKKCDRGIMDKDHFNYIERPPGFVLKGEESAKT